MYYLCQIQIQYTSLVTFLLTHGVAPVALSLSTLVPIPKNTRVNNCDYRNYTQIAFVPSNIICSLYNKNTTMRKY